MKYFSPRLIAIHLIAVLIIVICGLFAQWQWNRAHFTRINSAPHQVVPFENLSVAKDFLPVSSIGAQTVAQGTWQPSSRFVLTNRPRDGRLLLDTEENRKQLANEPRGTWVVDLLSLKDGTSVAVVRGWTDTKKIPDQTTAVATVTGVVQPAEDAPGVDFIELPEQLTTKLVLEHSASDVRDGFIVDSSAPTEFNSVTPTREPVTSNGLHWRNVVYTFNWIFFGILTILMWWRIINEEQNELSTPEVS